MPLVSRQLAGCRKLAGVCRNFIDLQVWDNRRAQCRILKNLVHQGRGVSLGYVEGLNDARTMLAGFFSILLDGFLDFATAQAACTNPNTLCLTVDQGSDWLEVGLEDPFSLVIGMTDVMA